MHKYQIQVWLSKEQEWVSIRSYGAAKQRDSVLKECQRQYIAYYRAFDQM